MCQPLGHGNGGNYFKLNTMTVINNIQDLKNAINHPYRSSEFLTDGTNIFEVSDNDYENEALIETYGSNELFYSVLWEGEPIFTESGIEIEPVY